VFTYEWAAARGTIAPANASEVTYTAPDTPGADVISVKVMNDSQSVVLGCTYDITAPLPPDYDWESCTAEGGVAQTYEDSQGIESVEGSSDAAKTGNCSLRLNARLQAQHSNFSKGEAYVQLPAPVALNGVELECWVYVPNPDATGPEGAPNGAQLFVKDVSFKSEYGSWVNLAQIGWIRVTLMPTTAAPYGGYMDRGFDPNAVLILGVKIGTNDQADPDYSYGGPFYVDSCTSELSDK
jgi:hypothetical protein